MTVTDEFLGPFLELIEGVASIEVIRKAGQGPVAAEVWQAIVTSGFVDALICEEQGGAGLSMSDVHPLLLACGKQLLPPAYGQTVLARALISSAGQRSPEEPIVLWPETRERQLRSLVLPPACEGLLALTQHGSTMKVRRLRSAPELADGFGLVPATLIEEPPLLEFGAPEIDLLDYAAASVAVSMAGAMIKLVEMSLAFANDRRQFGRPLSAFQVIQHQLSIMAEEVVLAITASRIAFAGAGITVDPVRTAIAKVIANEAASRVCTAAHAVHGAIGMTAECDLQLYSRRLRRWQVSFGSTDFWAGRIGTARLASSAADCVDFIRAT
jgi:acyl-CoA dehydrogenase